MEFPHVSRNSDDLMKRGVVYLRAIATEIGVIPPTTEAKQAFDALTQEARVSSILTALATIDKEDGDVPEQKAPEAAPAPKREYKKQPKKVAEAAPEPEPVPATPPTQMQVPGVPEADMALALQKLAALEAALADVKNQASIAASNSTEIYKIVELLREQNKFLVRLCKAALHLVASAAEMQTNGIAATYEDLMNEAWSGGSKLQVPSEALQGKVGK